VGYFASNSKNGAIIINKGNFRLEGDNIENNDNESKYCIQCNKSDPSNQLLLCNNCKYNLTHISCGKIDVSEIQDFICFKCKEQ
jgi:hypothetical protein